MDEVRALNGELGFKGERGYSAYEIAVQNGYEGTEQEWIDHFGLDLTDYIKTSDVVDNLTSTTTTKPLSANQGKVLKDSLDTMGTTVSGKADTTDVILKGDIAIITGTITNDKQTNLVEINYPTGFDGSNCVFVGGTLGLAIIPESLYSQSGGSLVASSVISLLMDSNIMMLLWSSTDAEQGAKNDYKIVLMKLPEEEEE